MSLQAADRWMNTTCSHDEKLYATDCQDCLADLIGERDLEVEARLKARIVLAEPFGDPS